MIRQLVHISVCLQIKSGSEIAFPMLFGHLSFMTHRCWKVFMRKSIYLAAEAWHRRYGQADTAESAPAASITYAVPGTGQQVAMPGWSGVQRDGERWRLRRTLVVSIS